MKKFRPTQTIAFALTLVIALMSTPAVYAQDSDKTGGQESETFTFALTPNGMKLVDPSKVPLPKPKTTPVPANIPDQEASAQSDFDYDLETFAAEIFHYTNVVRAEHGLSELKSDATLSDMAQARIDENNHVMTHTRPDGTGAHTIFKEYDTVLKCTGEIIQGAGATPENVVRGFLETSHRENLLSPDAEYVGVGVAWTDTIIGSRITTLELFAK